MGNFEQRYAPPQEDDLKRIEELERKKQVKRENRLSRIAEKNFKLLKSIFPEDANNFEIVYEEIQEAESSIFKGEKTIFRNSDRPVYGIILRMKSDPEKKFQIEHWLRPDLDAKKENFDMMFNQNFSDRIQKGVERLKRSEE